VRLDASICNFLSSCSLFACADLSSRGFRAACISRRDDHEAHGENAGAERRPAENPREGQHDHAVVGATESKPFASIPISPFFRTGRGMFVDLDLLTFSKSQADIEQSQMAQEQVAIELG
jgi:hypothetical protein